MTEQLWPIAIPPHALPEAERKRILLGDGDRLALFPLAHPWAWDAYKAMQENHWRPSEIPMGPDLAWWSDPAGLTDAERRLYMVVFGQLTTFDLLRAQDAAETLLPLTSSPELALALQWMIAQEGLHSESYQWCIDGLGLSYAETYSLYRAIPVLSERVSTAMSMSLNLASLASSEAGERSASTEMAREAIATCVFWFLCFEGIWFVANLAGPVQSLARRGLMTATAEQFQYILRDEYTHINLGVALIRALRDEHPDAWDEELLARIHSIVNVSIQLEDRFIETALPRPVLGYSAHDHQTLARHLANQRLHAIGLEPAYPFARNPYPWIDEMTGALRKEKNFFETRVTEYRKGALTWED